MRVFGPKRRDHLRCGVSRLRMIASPRFAVAWSRVISGSWTAELVAVSGPGLQARMALSYALVAFVVVVLAGAVLLLVVGPRLVSAADGGARVRTTATRDAATLTAVTRKLARLPNARELQAQLEGLAPGAPSPG